MKIDLLINCASKAALALGVILISSSCVNAWTISVLDPLNHMDGISVLRDNRFDAFESYMTDNGATLTLSSLVDYDGKADAVIVNVANMSATYTDDELTKLSSLLHSNTRVLVFGELSSAWDTSNQQLANLLGGVNYYSGQGFVSRNAQTVNPDRYPLITEGINNISFASPGKISPSGGNGLSLSSDDGITLWGSNDNFLLFMDTNILCTHIQSAPDNDKLARNVADWLSGVDITPTPEPSAYAMLLGMAVTGTVFLRRRRR